MDHKKIRRVFAYALLAFLLILYVAMVVTFITKGFEAGLGLFAYNVFFTIIVYFFLMWQRRMEERARQLSGESTQEDEESDN